MFSTPNKITPYIRVTIPRTTSQILHGQTKLLICLRLKAYKQFEQYTRLLNGFSLSSKIFQSTFVAIRYDKTHCHAIYIWHVFMNHTYYVVKAPFKPHIISESYMKRNHNFFGDRDGGRELFLWSNSLHVNRVTDGEILLTINSTSYFNGGSWNLVTLMPIKYNI